MSLLRSIATAALVAFALALASAGPGRAAPADVTPTAPVKPADGGTWRIGYYEGGQYPDYAVILKATVRGLINLGWMEPLDLEPPEVDVTEPGALWRYLSANAQSDYITFVEDAFYAAGNFDREVRQEVRERLVERLAEEDGIDLMIAMGTWAGQDLANDRHAVPTIVMSTSDPIGSGIVPGAEDSGHAHVHAKVEPDRYARQVELFHDIIGFSSLGVVYEDSPEGRTFAAVEPIQRVAKARGFTVESCNAPFNDVEQAESEAAVVACYARLAETADAVYLTAHRGLNATTLPAAVAPLVEAGVPTFSMLGESEVRRGVLMSVAQNNYAYVGQFHADTIARVFNGAAPGDLSQVWLAPAKIALNLKTAELIGYDPPVDILLASDEIFQTIADE